MKMQGKYKTTCDAEATVHSYPLCRVLRGETSRNVPGQSGG